MIGAHQGDHPHYRSGLSHIEPRNGSRPWIFILGINRGGKSFARATGNGYPRAHDGELESALAALGRGPGNSIIVSPDVFTLAHRDLIIALAARHRLPAVYVWRFAQSQEACCHMASISTICFVEQLRTSIAFSEVPSRPTCPFSSRPNSNW
jgi:hypothetical protein